MGITIAVVSDTHGDMKILSSVIKESSPFDIIIHCGDGVKDICSADFPDNTIVLKVKGNTDLDPVCDVDDIIIEKILGRTIMVAHGHQFKVKTGLKSLINAAVTVNADVVLFGHTHEQFFAGGYPLLFNPGCLSSGNYGIIRASEEDWFFEHKKIKEG
jgi:uncharacterized protein